VIEQNLFGWQTSPFDTPQEEHLGVKQRPADTKKIQKVWF